MKTIHRLLIAIICLLQASCGPNTHEAIKSRKWKYVEGEMLARQEVLAFGSMFGLRGDTIYVFDSPQAVISDMFNSRAGNIGLVIQSLQSRKSGTYYDAGDVQASDTIEQTRVTSVIPTK